MGSSKKNQKGLKAEEIFKKFESGMNELLKADTEFWTAARIISGEMIEEYSEEVIGNNIKGWENLAKLIIAYENILFRYSAGEDTILVLIN